MIVNSSGRYLSRTVHDHEQQGMRESRWHWVITVSMPHCGGYRAVVRAGDWWRAGKLGLVCRMRYLRAGGPWRGVRREAGVSGGRRMRRRHRLGRRLDEADLGVAQGAGRAGYVVAVGGVHVDGD